MGLTPLPVPYYRKEALRCFSPLTSRAGVAQGAADFVLVQVGQRDHEHVGAPAQGAVVRSLAPHFLSGQRTAGHGGAGGDVAGTGTLAILALPLSHRPGPGETSYRQVRDAAWPRLKHQNRSPA